MKRVIAIICLLLVPALARGATYYVAKGGNDSFSCNEARSVYAPRRTITGGLSCLLAGDTLIIKGGTYSEGISAGKIPSGISNGSPTTVRAAVGETVVINGVNSIGDSLTISDRSYIVLDGLIFDGHRIRIGGNGPKYSHYITVQNSIIANTNSANYPPTSQSCVTQQGPGGANSQINFINNEVYNCGPETGHGIYLSARDSLVEGNRVHDNAKYGIHVFSQKGSVDNNIIRYNHVYRNGSFGILVGSGFNNKVYGNTVNNNRMGGIRIGFNRPQNNQVYDNNIYENNGDCVRVKADAFDSKVEYNSCQKNTKNAVLKEGSKND